MNGKSNNAFSDSTWNEKVRNLCVPHQASDWSFMTTQHIDTHILCVVPYTNSTTKTDTQEILFNSFEMKTFNSIWNNVIT